MLLVRLAPVGACFLLCFLLARIAGGRNRIARDWRLYWIFAALTTAAALLLIAEVTSALDSLDRTTLALAWSGVDAVLTGLIFWKFRADVIEIASIVMHESGWARIVEKFKARMAGPERSTYWLYGIGVGFGFFLGVISWQAPTFVWDCKSYHVPRILSWVQDRSLRAFPTSDIRRVAYAPGAEIASTTFYELDGSDRPINLPSWIAVVSSAILASFLTELLAKLFSERTGRDFSREKARLAAAFAFTLVLTIPEGLIQAISTENDFIAALWNLSLACMTILFLRQKANPYYALAMALSLALGICTKVTTFISAAPFLAGAFGLLAWRRSFDTALKLGVVLAAAVIVVNGPWILRNYQVFGHLLGPANVSAENVNPSFGPGRDLANIIRNVSIYTSTPSATVTTALNNAVRAVVSWTGHPLDDPTSVVPYRDPNQSLHFSLAGPAEMGSGGGVGNISAWLIFSACVIAIGFPLCNALGFHAAASVSGFLLSCIYLRWHPWLFRYHMTYFVLAMPLVAISFAMTARRPFILILAGMCLVNSLLILGFNTQYPIYAPFLKLTREQHQFGSNLNLHRPYIALAEDIIGRGCTNVLLKCEPYNFDYGLWVCLRDRGYRGTIEEFQVRNETGRLARTEVTALTAMVFIGGPALERVAMEIDGTQRPLLEIEYLSRTGKVTAQFPSAFPGKWCRLLGPENYAELALTLSDTNGINPEKPAEIHFTCSPVDRDNDPLTNNVLRLGLNNRIADIGLRPGGVNVSAIVTQPSVVIGAILLGPVLSNKYPAYLSDPQVTWTPIKKP